MTHEIYDPRTFVEDHVFQASGVLGWLTRRRKRAVVRLLASRLDLLPGGRVLDVGCGYGDMLADIDAGLRVGVDLNPAALADAMSRAPGAHFAVSGVDCLPFPSGTFDGVICSEVLEHLERPALLAAEIDRVTKPGGSYCITVPNEAVTTLGRFLLGKRPAKSPAHKQAFTPRAVAALFPERPSVQQLTPMAALPFALSTNVVMLFTKS